MKTITHGRGGRWESTTEPENLPAIPACYVVYLDGALAYVGSSQNLAGRFNYGGGHHVRWAHYSNTRETPWGRYREVTVKFRPSVKFGDWAMVELRLIRRLQPPHNCRGSVKPVERTKGEKCLL